MQTDYSITRIKTDTLAKIRVRAQANHRSIPQELDAIVEQLERLAIHPEDVEKVEYLPGPADLPHQDVPVVYIRKPQ